MKSFISKSRTVNYLNQLGFSFVFKALAALSSFILIPISLHYLGVEKYGVWTTLLSILSWVVLIDLGIGNGLRNKVSESIAKNKWNNAQEFISTSYVIMGIAMIALLIILLILSEFIPWQTIFNTKVLSLTELKYTVNITLIFVLTNFVLSLINQVAHGVQKTGIVVFNQFLSNTISVVSTYILSRYTHGSIIFLAGIYGLSMTLSNVAISAVFYRKNTVLMPKFSFYKITRVRPLLSLGFKFFILQIAVIILFTTDKIIITQLLGPTYVTEYDVIFKLFSIITVIHSVIIAPLWVAYSDAYHRSDFIWMRSMMLNQIKFFALLTLLTVFLAITAPFILSIWIGVEFKVSMQLIIASAFFVLFLSWNNIFAYFLNGINQLNIQLTTSIIAMGINIPLSIYFIRSQSMGSEGVMLATIISLCMFAILGPLQTGYILCKKQTSKIL
jgi:O-antigen/teichoic acid export membrane protein